MKGPAKRTKTSSMRKVSETDPLSMAMAQKQRDTILLCNISSLQLSLTLMAHRFDPHPEQSWVIF